MKDYKLSEVAIRCIENQTLYNGTVLYNCKNCEFEQICSPTKWGSKVGEIIEPRDMIELPCKEHREGKDFYQIFWRKKNGQIGYEIKFTPEEANAFLAKLKGDRQ